MSIFSFITRSRRAAKEHKQKQAEKAAEKTAETSKEPYRHVPTHAAFDALSGAPSSFKHEDRPKIRELNRRSAMVTSGLTRMHEKNLPRVSSSLSHVSYPSVDATPIGNLPRPHSCSAFPPPAPYWQQPNKNYVYPVLSGSRLSLKGKEVDRSWDAGRNSLAFVKRSPSGSSSHSSISIEDLEMKITRPISRPPALRSPVVGAHAHRLRPRSRRPSDVSECSEDEVPAERPSKLRGRARSPPSLRLSLYANSWSVQQPTVASSAASSISLRSPSGFSSFHFNPHTSFSAPTSGRSSAATTPTACVTPEPVYESVEEEEEEEEGVVVELAGKQAQVPAEEKVQDQEENQEQKENQEEKQGEKPEEKQEEEPEIDGGGSDTQFGGSGFAAPAPSATMSRSSSNSKATRFTESDVIKTPAGSFCCDSDLPLMANDITKDAIVVKMMTATPSGVSVSNSSARHSLKQTVSKINNNVRWSTKSFAVAV